MRKEIQMEIANIILGVMVWSALISMLLFYLCAILTIFNIGWADDIFPPLSVINISIWVLFLIVCIVLNRIIYA